MATKKITAEVNGVQKTFTLDVPDGATNQDIADAIASYTPPDIQLASKKRIEGLQPQKNEPPQPTGGDWLTTLANVYGGVGLGGGLKGVAGMLGRPALAAMMGAGTNAAAGGDPLEGGLESGVLAAVPEVPGALKATGVKTKDALHAMISPKGFALKQLFKMMQGDATPEEVKALGNIIPNVNGTLAPNAIKPTVPPIPNSPLSTYIGGGNTIGPLTKTPPIVPKTSPRTPIWEQLQKLAEGAKKPEMTQAEKQKLINEVLKQLKAK